MAKRPFWVSLRYALPAALIIASVAFLIVRLVALVPTNGNPQLRVYSLFPAVESTSLSKNKLIECRMAAPFEAAIAALQGVEEVVFVEIPITLLWSALHRLEDAGSIVLIPLRDASSLRSDLVVLHKSEIKSPKDLLNGTIGVSDETHPSVILLRQIMRENYGLSYDSVYLLQTQAQALPELLSTGSVDAVFMDRTAVSLVKRGDEYRILLSLDQEQNSICPETAVISVLLFRRSSLPYLEIAAEALTAISRDAPVSNAIWGDSADRVSQLGHEIPGFLFDAQLLADLATIPIFMNLQSEGATLDSKLGPD